MNLLFALFFNSIVKVVHRGIGHQLTLTYGPRAYSKGGRLSAAGRQQVS